MQNTVQVWRGGGACGRRSFLVGTAGVAALAGCGYFPAEQGDAYAPWDYPGGLSEPAELAVGAAILASSPHNTQPWLFAIDGEVIDVFADLERNLGAMDTLRREMHIGIGCAVENMVTAAAYAGRAASVAWSPDPADASHVARVVLGGGEEGDASLFAALAGRHTNRGPYADVRLDAKSLATLAGLVAMDPEVGFVLITDDEGRADFRAATIAATRAIIADAEMSEDSHHWFRHTAAQIEELRDGVTLDASGLGALTNVFGKIGAEPSRARSDKYWLKNTERTQTTGAGFVILTTPALEDRGQQQRCGRVFQRIALWATSQRLALQPLNQMAERRDREREPGIAPEFTSWLAALTGEAHAQMLFRFGIPWAEAKASPRRPTDWVVLP